MEEWLQWHNSSREEKEQYITELFAQGKTAHQISTIVHVTVGRVNTIKRRAERTQREKEKKHENSAGDFPRES